LAQKKTARLSAGGFFGMLRLSLAGPFRQVAGEVEEAKEEPAAHDFGFCHKTIWVHLKRAITLPSASFVTTASQT
jgi:hypothetical protein